MFLLSRIAINNVKTKGDIKGNLKDFFTTKLGFPDTIEVTRAKITFEDVTRRIAGLDDDEYGSEDDEEEGWDSDDNEMDENQRKLMEFLAKKAEEEKDFIIDFD